MKILVATKRVPDPEGPIRIRPDSASIDEDGVAFVLNPFDAIALEEALRIRECGPAPVEVLAVGIGREAYEEQLRTALAMGADRALLVRTDALLDPWNVARVLAALVEREQPEIVLMGKQAVDDDANQTGQFLAALLAWPQATFASRVELIAGEGPRTARVERETDAGLETVRVTLPAVITTDLRLNQPRYASLPSIMRARKRPVETLTVAQLGVSVDPRLRVLRLELAPSRRPCVRVEDIDELVERLRGEAKVI